MISLDTEGAVLVVGIAAASAIGWAVNLSLRSVVRGPSWALSHLRGAGRLLMALLLAGVLVLILVDPVWAGLAVLYVGVMVWFLAGLLRRNLARLERTHGFDEVPPERKAEIVSRSRRFLFIVAAGVAVVGVAVWGASPATAGVAITIGVMLAVAAWRVG